MPADPHQEVVGFNVSVDEIFGVNKLDSINHLRKKWERKNKIHIPHEDTQYKSYVST